MSLGMSHHTDRQFIKFQMNLKLPLLSAVMLKNEAAGYSELLDHLNKTGRCHIPEDVNQMS
jgi:hypothetical protein